MKIPRCPRCRKQPYQIIEVALMYLEWDIENEKIEDGGTRRGDIMYCVALCECGYEWQLRKIYQITDIDEKYFKEDKNNE